MKNKVGTGDGITGWGDGIDLLGDVTEPRQFAITLRNALRELVLQAKTLADKYSEGYVVLSPGVWDSPLHVKSTETI